MAKGGKRKGAGRKVGSTNRPVLRNFYTREELEEFVIDLKESAKTDPVIKKFVAEQIFGKAVQPIGNDEGNPLLISFDKTFNETTPEAKGDSTE